MKLLDAGALPPPATKLLLKPLLFKGPLRKLEFAVEAGSLKPNPTGIAAAEPTDCCLYFAPLSILDKLVLPGPPVVITPSVFEPLIASIIPLVPLTPELG